MKRNCKLSVRLFLSISVILFILLPVVSGEEINSGPLPQSSTLKVSTFDIDATPPVGYKMAYNPVVMTGDMGLRAKGIVLTGAGQPIVLVAFDWIGIANESQDEFKRAIAGAAGTIPQRVAVHCLHQHDAPRGDIQSDFVITVLHRLEMAISKSLEQSQPVTHIGLGTARVEKVASNRRILGQDGKVRVTRWTASPDPAIRAEPEGLIDPVLSEVSFWNGEKPVAVLSFYATHPQSYYQTGIPNPDFPGIARFQRQLAVPDALHIHFTGAGGNVGAGKYNDGSHEMRGILAARVADGMKRAWESTKKIPVTASSVKWNTEPVAMMPDSVKNASIRSSSFFLRYKAGKKIDIGCLTLGNARILFMPGELCVEYQIAAKAMRPDLFVAMAAYGDGGPGYIPTAKAFAEGGYEPSASRVTPQAEAVLMGAMRKLLNAKK
jgi:hypothetical protein